MFTEFPWILDEVQCLNERFTIGGCQLKKRDFGCQSLYKMSFNIHTKILSQCERLCNDLAMKKVQQFCHSIDIKTFT